MLKKLCAVMRMPSARQIKGNYPVLTGVPTNYVIDRLGRVIYAKAEAFGLDARNEILIPLIKAPTSTH